MTTSRAHLFLVLLCIVGCQSAWALTEAFVPTWRCDPSRALESGFENADVSPPERPSGGSGGELGKNVITLTIGSGVVTYYLHFPPGYNGPDHVGEVLPLVVGLHGAGGPGSQAFAASSVRNAFSNLFDNGDRFIIVAPESSGSQGGWILTLDQAKILAVIEDATSRFNIDRNRIYLWGFSAGGQMAHYAALSNGSPITSYTAHAGRVPLVGSSFTGMPETSSRKVPLLMTHGTSDTTVPYSIAQSDRLRFLNSGWIESGVGGSGNYETGNFQLIPLDMGHTFDIAVLSTSWRWMCERAALP